MNLRHKYYFLDYSPLISVAKRVIAFLLRDESNAERTFKFTALLKYLRWYNDDTGKYINKSMAMDDMFRFVLQALEVLKDIGIITDYGSDIATAGLNNVSLTIMINDLHANLEAKLEFHGYYPIEGRKQILTTEQLHRYNTALKINYDALLNMAKARSTDYTTCMNEYANLLREEFEETYCRMCNKDAQPYKTTFGSITCLYDLATEWESDESSDLFIQDRVVAFYGFSGAKLKDRKEIENDMRKTLKEVWADKETDKGHFVGHSLGGDINENIFPQSRSFNQNKTARGKVFRKMEDYCKNNPGTFFFSRPVYFDFSIRPYILEYGLVKSNYDLLVEHFINV